MGVSKLILKPGRETSVLRRHPWIFEGGIARIEGSPIPGETVMIEDATGRRLARAAFSPASQIRARVWTFDPETEVNEALLRTRITQAHSLRRELRHRTNGWRWVHSESDGMPGLIVDVYASYAVAQFLSAGMEHWKTPIAGILGSFDGIKGVFEKSDADARKKEGLAPAAGMLLGEAPPSRVILEENSIRLAVDVREGHKTGFYLDQRDNRGIISDLARGAEALNAFCYTGGFTVAMLQGGASRVTSVESSASALKLARANLELNKANPASAEFVEDDVFQFLRQCRDARRNFDLIVLDPPKFAASRAALDRAARAYKDINLLAMKLLRPGGALVTFSCSGLVGADMFQKILFGAALDAGCDMQIVRRLGQPEDHPVLLTFPEGEYLKGFVLRRAG